MKVSRKILSVLLAAAILLSATPLAALGIFGYAAIPAPAACAAEPGSDSCIDGHSSEIVPGKAATCTETGLSNGVRCAVCGEILMEQMELAALGHTIAAIPAKPATCTETGLVNGTKCLVCDAVLIAPMEVAAFGHIDSTADGICDRCGADLGTEEPQGELSFIEKISAFFRKIIDFFKNLFN